MWRQPKPESIKRVKRVQPEHFVICDVCGERRPACVKVCAL